MNASFAVERQHRSEFICTVAQHTDIQNRAEAAASKLGQLINPKHLYIVSGAALPGQPLLQLHHLHVLEANASIDRFLDNGLAHVHPTSDRGVLVRGHPVVLGQLIDLDLATQVRWTKQDQEYGSGCTLPNSPTYPMRFPFRERNSVVIPLSFRYTTPVKGSSSRDPIDVTGKPRAFA